MGSVMESPEKAGTAQPLWTRQFVYILGATLFAYANMSLFFSFYGYLRSLGIDPEWYGVLMGVFSAVSLAVRPVVSPFFHSRNARRYLYIGTAMLIAALASYSLVKGFWGMFLVRGFHGLAFVVVGSALMSLIIDYIPEGRSARVFGMIAIITLIPNTGIPPVLPFLIRALGGFTQVLMLFAGISLLIFPMIVILSPPGEEPGSSRMNRPLSFREVRQDLRERRVLLTLAAMLLLYSGHALVFFFLDGYGRSIGIVGTGFFPTLATVSEIGVRVAAGSLFDRMSKGRLLTWTMIGLAVGYAALAHVPNRVAFFALGAVLGLGCGIAMPVFNGLMFDLSEPKFRAFNINLGLQMFQGGFFLGPFLGGPFVAHWGFGRLFYLCALFSLASACAVFFLRGRGIK